MKIKMFKTLAILFLLNIFLSACQTMSDAAKVLRNEKINQADQFLIKKKDPLSQPPNFDELPVPGKQSVKENNDIEKILSIPTKNVTDGNNSSIEESVLKKIRK